MSARASKSWTDRRSTKKGARCIFCNGVAKQRCSNLIGKREEPDPPRYAESRAQAIQAIDSARKTLVHHINLGAHQPAKGFRIQRPA
jgi:hypothetical protein